MFVMSIRISTIKIAAVLAALAIVVAAAFWEGGVARSMTDSIDETPVSETAVSTAEHTELATNKQRVAFLESLGWKVDGSPVEVAEVIIPQTFNKVYNNYNAIQKAQGYDLSKYRGVRAKRWVYNIKNYPGVLDGVHANLLIYNNRLIGGDVSSVELNGFMQGLKKDSTQSGIKPSGADIVAETFKTNNLK